MKINTTLVNGEPRVKMNHLLPGTEGQQWILCNGCNTCVEVCQADLLIPNPGKEGEPPFVLYPEECWYGGCYIAMCPKPGAIKINHALTQRVRWRRKETGEHFGV